MGELFRFSLKNGGSINNAQQYYEIGMVGFHCFNPTY